MLSAGGAGAHGVPLKERIEACASCHGEDGNSRLENVPSIAGQPEFFIVNQLVLMREGVRPVEAMTPFVKDLKDEAIVALGKHFSNLAARRSDEPLDGELVKRGAALAADKKCMSCHGPELAGDQQIPRIAGQRIDYLTQALKEFRDGTRKGADTIMSAPVAGLSDADLAALAHYSASR